MAAVDEVLSRRLVCVTGKGGTGKSTVAAALGLAGARRGKRTVVVEVAARRDVEHHVATAGVDHVSIDPQDALELYLRDQLPRGASDVLARSRTFAYLAAATPGLRELLTAGRVWELCQDERREPGAQPYDLVVCDLPATGHGTAVLDAPRSFAQAAKVGPVARQGGIIDAMLSDPQRTAVVAVTTPEELPVNETLALAHSRDLALVLANGVRRGTLADAERDALRAVEHPGARAALTLERRARDHRAQLARLRRGVDAPVLALPFCPDGEGSADVTALSARL